MLNPPYRQSLSEKVRDLPFVKLMDLSLLEEGYGYCGGATEPGLAKYKRSETDSLVVHVYPNDTGTTLLYIRNCPGRWRRRQRHPTLFVGAVGLRHKQDVA